MSSKGLEVETGGTPGSPAPYAPWRAGAPALTPVGKPAELIRPSCCRELNQVLGCEPAISSAGLEREALASMAACCNAVMFCTVQGGDIGASVRLEIKEYLITREQNKIMTRNYIS
jgi:hypothetical protein